jgi:archaellum component FlaC
MSDNTDNLVLEHLRAMRGDIGEIKSRLDRMDLRLSVIEQTIGSLYALSASDRETLQSVIKRVERIERRLDLSDA